MEELGRDVMRMVVFFWVKQNEEDCQGKNYREDVSDLEVLEGKPVPHPTRRG